MAALYLLHPHRDAPPAPGRIGLDWRHVIQEKQ
jgi:hypothetical protein